MKIIFYCILVLLIVPVVCYASISMPEMSFLDSEVWDAASVIVFLCVSALLITQIFSLFKKV